MLATYLALLLAAPVSLNPADGSLLAPVKAPLWSLQFQGGATLLPSACRVRVEGRTYTFEGDSATVVVTVAPGEGATDLRAKVTSKRGTVLGLSLPGRAEFDLAAGDSLVVPQDGNAGVGLELTSRWFGLQPQEHPSAWRHSAFGEPGTGGDGYRVLFGGSPRMRPLDDEPTALRVTEAGRELFGPALSGRVAGGRASVIRPPAADAGGQTLIDSDNGPFLWNLPLGRGRAWRFTGRSDGPVATLVADCAVAALGKLGSARREVALLAVEHGPLAGGFSGLTVDGWRNTLRRLPGGLVELPTAQALLDALASERLAAIVNPYGEGLPALDGQSPADVAAKIRAWVEAGGHWFETSGYPFHYALRPVRTFDYQVSYPAAFADFLHLRRAAGSLAVYGVQPRTWAPWSANQQPNASFVPGELRCGGRDGGGWLEHRFGAYIKEGATWESPVARLSIATDTAAALADYAAANQLTRTLADKVAPAVLDQLKRSVLVFIGGSAKEKTAHLEELPRPALVHFADYLKGGFDKQYPDHLPPNPGFGTAADLRAMFDRAHALGLLVSPYTNPTWWCTDPKGPTFEREGDAPLLRRLDGSVSYEKYANNGGYTITYWHPAVRAANERTVRQFTEDFPVDVLFQDQCGARGWSFDLNPASPTPLAYSEGVLSMVAQDSRRVPLATESGWDRVANEELLLCGLSWELSPHRPERNVANRYPRGTWRVYPLAQRLASRQCLLEYHDLGQFVTDEPTLAWALALDFSLNYRAAASALGKPAVSGWLAWLDRLQKSVCARSLGQPVGAFEQRRAGDDDGVVEAQYGPVQMTVNLTGGARDGLAPWGFSATAPGLRASGSPEGSFVSDGRDLWCYAPGGATLPVRLADPLDGAVTVSFDGGQPQRVTALAGQIAVTTPRAADGPAPLPRPTTAPHTWAAKPQVAVVDLGAGAHLAWTKVGPDAWVDALTGQVGGLEVVRLTTPAAVLERLRGGVERTLAIVNPYGEGFPCPVGTAPTTVLDAVAAYVRGGGSWVETGGYSFHNALGANVRIGPNGLAHFGLATGDGEVEAPPEPVTVTPTGRAWLGEELAARLEKVPQVVNRSLPRGSSDVGHLTLVAGASGDWCGGYQLGGWGWLWRFGGFYPGEAETPAVVRGLLAHLATTPPAAPLAFGVKRLWHATVAGGNG